MAPTAILLPGNMCDARLWRGGDHALHHALARAGITAVTDADVYQDDNMANMAQRALDSVSGPVLPVGFSMGAIVAMEMAVLEPDRVCGMVLCGYNATADLPDRAAIRPSQQAQVRDGGLERVLVEELKPNYLAAANRRNTDLLALLRDMGMTLGPDVFVQQSEALRLRADRVAQLAALRVPVLYIAGAEDTLCPPAWHRRWAMETPGSRCAEIAGAGHMVPLETPQDFAAVVAHWIQDHQGELGL